MKVHIFSLFWFEVGLLSVVWFSLDGRLRGVKTAVLLGLSGWMLLLLSERVVMFRGWRGHVLF